jgi:hypothetical protein
MKRVKLLKKPKFEYCPRDPFRLLQRIYGKDGAAPHIAAMKSASAKQHLVPDAETADPIVAKLFEDITLARQLERAAWDRLTRYLERA